MQTLIASGFAGRIGRRVSLTLPMSAEKSPTTAEREQTDESLRIERQKADEVLGDKAAIEEAADAVVERARALADDVIEKGRARTDHASRMQGEEARPAHVARERQREDEVLQEERDQADEVLRVERAEGAALLAHERGATDKDLSAERSRSDNAVATRDDFLGMVSHDLRNMLSAIVGFAALIVKAESENPAPHTDEVLVYARRIERATGRMNRLIGDLVDVASIEAGALGVTLEVGDPRAIVSEVVDQLRSHASACGVTVTSDFGPGGERAQFDSARLLQVLANLVGNAVKFTPRGGRVVVRIAREIDHIRFEVRDTGIGIAAADLDAIFERFHQVKRADSRGAGLGLYISKCIVQGHGGRIGVESHLNEGSTFWFTLPARTET
jgi:signal transduction histidine kinase